MGYPSLTFNIRWSQLGCEFLDVPSLTLCVVFLLPLCHGAPVTEQHGVSLVLCITGALFLLFWQLLDGAQSVQPEASLLWGTTQVALQFCVVSPLAGHQGRAGGCPWQQSSPGLDRGGLCSAEQGSKGDGGIRKRLGHGGGGRRLSVVLWFLWELP